MISKRYETSRRLSLKLLFDTIFCSDKFWQFVGFNRFCSSLAVKFVMGPEGVMLKKKQALNLLSALAHYAVKNLPAQGLNSDYSMDPFEEYSPTFL